MKFSGVALIALSASLLPVGSAAVVPGIPVELSSSPDGYLARACEFAEKGLWGAVADQLDVYIARRVIPQQIVDNQDILLLLGEAYANTRNPRCLDLLDRYILLYPLSPDIPYAEMVRADFLFFTGDYSEAYQAYKNINTALLTDDLKSRTLYRQAFSMLKCGLISESRPIFNYLSSNPEYADAALFYDAYVDYVERKYKDAYDKFVKLAPEFGNTTRRKGRITHRKASDIASRYQPHGLEAGYYIVQLDYLRGNYESVVKEAQQLMLTTPVAEFMSDTRKVLGLGYFKLGENDAAYPILSEYVEKAGDGAYYEACYALGTLLYDRGEKEKAFRLFEPLTQYSDAIGQSALLYMGQIASERGDDNSAAISFEKAARMAYDKEVTRSALYNYVAALTRGGSIPFDTKVDLLNRYVNEFPESDRTPAVREYLAATYYRSGDFKSALSNIDGIANPSARVKQAKQKILYELGMQYLIEGEAAQAVDVLKRAVALGNINPGLLPQASLWLGDAYSALGSWKSASDAYSAALGKTVADQYSNKLGDNRILALYGYAYSLFKQKKYKEAIPYYRHAAAMTSPWPSVADDAKVGLADCLYYSGNVRDALREFTDIENSGAKMSDDNVDYATLRRAEILGLNNDTAGKIAELENLARKGKSNWMPDVLLSLGDALADGGEPRKAIPPLKRLVREYSSSPQAQLADETLRRLYAAEGNLMEYSDFLKSISSPFSIDMGEVDQITFESALDKFNNHGDISGLTKYIEDFPMGKNTPEANWLVADRYEDKGESRKAEKMYKRILELGDSRWISAANVGLMRTASKASERYAYAQKVLSSGNVDASVNNEAMFVSAESLAEMNRGGEAEKIWRRLAENPGESTGARSAVALGEYLLRKGDKNGAQSVLEKFVDSATSQTYWLAKGYIALSDVMAAKGDKYAARQYLESLHDNYPGDEKDIKETIARKLREL